MDLNELFKIQAKLDERIEHEHGLEGQDLLYKKILALLTELGELANEHRGFKLWSKDQEPRTETVCWNCEGTGGHMGYIEAPMIEYTLVACWDCNGTGIYKKPLLEEFVDVIHFMLSIGNDLGYQDIKIDSDYTEETADRTFIKVYSDIDSLLVDLGTDIFNKYAKESYEVLFNTFVGLGEIHLGFTWEQIEQAYMDKNKINHERQEAGY